MAVIFGMIIDDEDTDDKVTVDDMYRNYAILVDAKDNLSTHKDAYKVILKGADNPDAMVRFLAAQFIPEFFSSFPELADVAMLTQIELCQYGDVSIRIQAMKGVPRFAVGGYTESVVNHLTKFLWTDDTATLDQLNATLISIFKIDAEGALRGMFDVIDWSSGIKKEQKRVMEFLSTKLQTLPEDVMTEEVVEYVFAQTKRVMTNVTDEDFMLMMRVVSGLRVLQVKRGRQRLAKVVVEQAFLALNPARHDTVECLMQCTRQPLFSDM